jgi:hypothetical protein
MKKIYNPNLIIKIDSNILWFKLDYIFIIEIDNFNYYKIIGNLSFKLNF